MDLKRATRSRGNADDVRLFELGQESPFKKARSKRNRTTTNGTTSSTEPPSTAEQSTPEDESLLLSSNKPEAQLREPSPSDEKTSKRSASPPPHDEYAQTTLTLEMGRELKRLKTDLASADSKKPRSAGEPSHTRNLSDSTAMPRKRRVRQGSKLVAGEASSAGQSAESTPPPDPVTGRAQSVPVFPTTYEIPHIDLRHPPPSPVRSRSRPPSKESTPLLRMRPLPAASGSLDTIPGSPDKMNVDSGEAYPQEHTPQATLSKEDEPILTGKQSENPFIQPSSPKVKASKEVLFKVAETPVTVPDVNALGLSPLTPVPPTPNPTKFEATQSKLREVARAQSLAKEVGPPSTQDPAKPAAKPKIVAGPSKVAPKSTGTNAKGTKPQINAFAMLMSKSRGNAATPKAAEPSKPQRPVVSQQQSIFGEPSKPKPVGSKLAKSMKSGMKPKAKRDPTAAPALVPIPVDEEGADQDELAQEKEEKESGTPNAEQETPLTELPVGPEANSEPSVPAPEPSVPAPQVETEAEEVPSMDKEKEAIALVEEPTPLAESPPHPHPEQIPEPRDIPTSPMAESPPTEEPVEAPISSEPARDGEDPSAGDVQEDILVPLNDVEMEDAQVNEEGRQTETEENVEMDGPEGEKAGEDGSETGERGQEVAQDAEVQMQEDQNQVVKEKQNGVEPSATTAPAEEKRRSTRQSRLPRAPSVPPKARTTRSTSTARNKKDTKAPEPPKSKAVASKPTKPPAASTSAKPIARSISQDLVQKKATAPAEGSRPKTPNLPPASPMKTGTPGKHLVTPTRNSPRLRASISTPQLRTPGASPSKSRIPVKRLHSPSPAKPMKLARSASGSMHSRSTSESRFTGSGTLSTLSSALEKLRMPAPSRPNTSLGFNRDLSKDDDSTPPAPITKVQDDSHLGKKSTGHQPVVTKGKPVSSAAAPGVGRSSTLGAPSFLNKGKVPVASGSGSKPLKQSTLFFPKVGISSHKKPFMGVGHGRAPKASRNPGLATVIGSPVKGGGADSSMAEGAEEEDTGFVGNKEGEEASPFIEAVVPVITQDKGKGRAKDEFSTRRASAISHDLSESIQLFRAENKDGKGKGLMGPPPVPANLSARSTGSSTGSPGAATAGETSSTPPGRRSTRAAAAVAKEAVAGVFKKPSEVEKSPVNEALKFLKDCVIYVDVKTDDAEEAGSLFVEMLEGVGAKILQRVGQTCTHIVYKNGLQSTINRYKLLRDPKPMVVGIAWVVDCVEQRRKVPEDDYLIDLEEVSLLTNPSKRRRSLLPKLVSRPFTDISMAAESSTGGKDDANDGDVSMESASSIVLDDLPPLERARRRKSMMLPS